MNSPASPLAWLSAVLWPDASAHITPARGATTVEASSMGWWASPNSLEPHILVPAQPASARTAVRRYHDGQRGRDRIRSALAEAMMRSGPIGRLVLDRHRVVVSGAGRSELLDSLHQHLDLDELHVAVSLARPKSNRKPVLQLFDDRGRCVGFAKVGWTAHTTALVLNEADWLRARPGRPILAPEVSHVIQLDCQTVVVTSPVSGSRWPRRRRLNCPLEVVKAVAAMDDSGPSSVEELAWTQQVLQVLDAATADERILVEAILDEFAAETIDPGVWHGDLTPWNLLTSSRGIGLIDWEFASAGVPVGFDVCHFHTQVGMELCGLDAGAALARAASLARTDLLRLEQSPATAQVVWQLYLVELVRRTLALRRSGFDTTTVQQGPAALSLLLGSHPERNRIELEEATR